MLSLVAMGLSDQEIAERTLLSLNSIKSYIRSAYRKIDVTPAPRPCSGAWSTGCAPTTSDRRVPARNRLLLSPRFSG